MEAFMAKLKSFNDAWNDIPRRAMIVIVTFLGLMLAWASFRYLSPLVFALVFSWLVKPIARPLERLFGKIRLPKRLGALLALIVVFGVMFAALIWLVTALAGEAKSLLDSLPHYIEETADYITGIAGRASEMVQDQVGDEALNAIYEMLMAALNKLAGMASSFAAWLVSFTFSAVMTLPDVVLFALFMIMECYYVVADRHVIGEFFRKLLPGKVADNGAKIKTVMVSGIRAQFITAVVQMVAAAVILVVGFSIMDMQYALMLGVIISVLDALPVIGAGLIMFPMMIFYVICADYMLALGNLALYLIVQVVKRVMEPKLLGTQMRLNQLATMVSMYAGYVMMGYLGLLIGPLMLKLFMAILSSSTGVQEAPQLAAVPAISRKRHRGK